MSKKKGARPETEPREPRIPSEDVRKILHRLIRPDEEVETNSVAMLAENADTSTRTIYRILDGTTKTLSLRLADNICVAAGAHISECRLVWPDGTYTDA